MSSAGVTEDDRSPEIQRLHDELVASKLREAEAHLTMKEFEQKLLQLQRNWQALMMFSVVFFGRIAVRTAADTVAWSVCRSVTIMNPAETAEPIEMSFGLWIRMELCIIWGSRSPMRRGNFEGVRGGPL